MTEWVVVNAMSIEKDELSTIDEIVVIVPDEKFLNKEEQEEGNKKKGKDWRKKKEKKEKKEKEKEAGKKNNVKNIVFLTRGYLLDVQKPWETNYNNYSEKEIIEIEKEELIQKIEKKVKAQFLLDFPRSRVLFRDLPVVSMEQFFKTLEMMVTPGLQKLAMMLCTQGCFALAWEEANRYVQQQLQQKEKNKEDNNILTDFPSGTDAPHMCVFFDFDDHDPKQIKCRLYKAFRLRPIQSIFDDYDNNNNNTNETAEKKMETIVHTLTCVDVIHPIKNIDKSYIKIWSEQVLHNKFTDASFLTHFR